MGSVSPAVPVAVAALLLLLASLALPAIAVPARREEEVRNLYKGWLLRHQRGRAYNALGKKERRFEIFKDILRFIDEHNAAADAGERSSRLARRRNGELMDYAFEFIITNGGIDTEKGYPYKERDGRCDSLRKNANVVSINSYENLPINDDKALQKAVANQPVSVSIEGGGRAFQLYESVNSSPCESPERINMLKSELASLLKKQIRDLSTKLQLAEQGKDHAQKQFLVLGEQHKAGPFGTVKASRTNPTVVPDESVNPRLAEILEKVAVRKELVVAVANSNVREMLEVWFNNIKRVGIPNYLVVALDDNIERFCKSKEVPVYRRNPDEAIDSIGKYGGNQAVSSLKFHILREFLLLGYSVLISDVDIVYLQNPFDHLYRDSDVESMSDGHNNMTAYGYDDVFDEPSMGWARYAHTMRIWAYDSGFFYIRPTIPSIELLDRVADRLSRQPNSWDQAVFNEELYFPSHPGYDGLHASKRTMDIHLFMNSMVLFKDVRKDAQLKKKKPVIVHVNYHPDKLSRMKAVVEFYVNGKQNALEPFPDGSDW